MHFELHTPEKDALLVGWWADLLSEPGGFEQLFVQPIMRNLGDFLAYFRGVYLCYTLEAGRISATFWLEPFLAGAFLGLWVAPKRRRSATIARLLAAQLEVAKSKCAVVFALTRQERLLRPAQRLGFKVLGGYNGLWMGAKAWLLALSAE